MVMENRERHVEIWAECLKIIRQIIEPGQYSTWFEPIRAVAFSDSKLTVEVPSDFFREYIEDAFQ